MVKRGKNLRVFIFEVVYCVVVNVFDYKICFFLVVINFFVLCEVVNELDE